MIRTSILLPQPLKQAAERVAKRRGKSLAALIREQLQNIIQDEGSNERKRDLLFKNFKIYAHEAPDDLATRHDDYLYGSVVE